MSVEENCAFEHKYHPQRAKMLFSRHRDIQAMLEREKQVLDWECHTVTSMMDKEKNRFSLRAEKLQAKIRQSQSSRGRVQSLGTVLPSISASCQVEFQSSKAPLEIIQTAPGNRNDPRRAVKSAFDRTVSSNSADNTLPRPSTDVQTATSQEGVIKNAPGRLHHPLTLKGRTMGRRVDSRPSVPAPRGVTSPRKEGQNLQLSLLEQNQIHTGLLETKIADFLDNIDLYKIEDQKSPEPKRAIKPLLDEKESDQGDEQTNQKRRLSIRNHYAAFSQLQKVQVAVTPLNAVDESAKESEQCGEKNVGAGADKTAQEEPIIVSVTTKGTRDHKMDTERDGVSTRKQTDGSLISKSLRKGEMSKRTPGALLRPATMSAPTATTISSLSRERIRMFLGNKNTEQEKAKNTKNTTVELLTEAWDAYTDDINEDNMRKLKAFSAKQKFKLRKSRPASIVPFMAARRAVVAFRTLLANKKKEREGALPDELEEVEEKYYKDLF